MPRASGTSLAPGFRFHPTDEELVRYYLKRKVSGKPLRYDPISDVDVYKCEPWDLPDKAKLKSRDLEWYFFSMLDKKYGNGLKTNRATENGYWKTTGKDRPIYKSSRVVGMKKTLVYHTGRAPRGQRSNWVMHEYRMADEELEKAGIAQDAFVLCRIFQKSGPGPKNGEQYGAPFVEEDWEEEVGGLFPEQQVMMDEIAAEEDTIVDRDEIDQNVTVAIAPESDPVPLEFHYGSSNNDNQHSEDIDGQHQTLPEDMGESQFEEQQYEDNKFFIIPEEYEMDVKPVKREFAPQPTDDAILGGSSSFPIGPFMDVSDNPLPEDDLSLNELSYTIEYPDGFNVDDYLTFFDADEDNLMTLDSSLLMMSNDVSVSAEPLQPLEDVCGEIEVPEIDTHPSVSNGNNEASSSQQNSEPKDIKPDFKHSFLKQASHMLGNFPAPPACASDYPIKGSALRLNSAALASSSVHVTAGMIRIRNLTLSSSSIEWSVGKNGELNIVLSFGFYQDDVVPGPASVYTPSLLPNKMPSVVSWSWAIVLVLWVLILAGISKVGMSVCSR